MASIQFYASPVSGHYLTDNNCWDVSEAQDGSIIAWAEDKTATFGGYGIHIAPTQAGTKIRANENCNYMFANLDINYAINGLNNIDFSKTKYTNYTKSQM